MSEVRAALVVANDRYDDPKLRRLQAPAEDAHALKEVLSDPAIGGYDVQFALNQREHELRLTLSRFFSDRKRDDLLLVHFSCHGLKDDDGDLYFAAKDTATEHLHATAIPAELVNRFVDQSASRRIVLMLDCCYGGAFRRGMRARADEHIDVKERLNGTGRVVLTASSAMEFAWEGDHLEGGRRPSVFTSAVVDGLRSGEADTDGDQKISVHELYDYVYGRIRAETPQQTPLKFGLEEGPLYIAQTRAVQPATLPDDLQAAIENNLAAVRVAAVRELQELLGDRHAGIALAAREALTRLGDDDSRSVSSAAKAALGQAAPAAELPTRAPTAARAKPPAAPAERVQSAAGLSGWLRSRPDSFWVPAAAGAAATVSVASSAFWCLQATDVGFYNGWSQRPEEEIAGNGSSGAFLAAVCFAGMLFSGSIAGVLSRGPWIRARAWLVIGAGLLAGLVGGVIASSPSSGQRSGYVIGYMIAGIAAGLAASFAVPSRLSALTGPLAGALAGLLVGAIVPLTAQTFAAYAVTNAFADGFLALTIAGALVWRVSGSRARADEPARVQ